MRTPGHPTPAGIKVPEQPVPPGSRLGPTLLFVGMAATLALQACAPRPQATHTPLPVYAIDQAGAAQSCIVSPLKPALADGKESATTMTLANDGGWCAIAVHQDGPAPFTAGLLTTRPEHGKVFVHSVGDETRIDYTPESRFGGNDSFVVRLLPGDAVIQAAAMVSITPGAASPVAEPPPVKPLPKKSVPRLPVKK